MESKKSSGNMDEEISRCVQMACCLSFVQSTMEAMYQVLAFLMLLSKRSKRLWTGTQAYRLVFSSTKFTLAGVFLEIAYQNKLLDYFFQLFYTLFDGQSTRGINIYPDALDQVASGIFVG